MTYLLVQHSVENFEQWKQGFDANGAARKAAGSKGGFVLRNADDPNQVDVLLAWDNLEDARAFASSKELREAMQNAGVVGAPNVTFLDEAAKPSA